MFDLGHLNVLAQYLSDPQKEQTYWYQIDPFLLLLLKAFVVFTCFFFWIKLLYDTLLRGGRSHRHHHDH